MTEYMLTTTDNPYNPFTEYDRWFMWDAEVGYHTPAYLARVVRTSDELSEADQDAAVQLGIDEIVEYNLNGKYIKVAAPN